MGFTITSRKNHLLTYKYTINVHVWLSYFDDIALSNGLWSFPYKVVPFLPAFASDAAIAPVALMLVFQWTLNYNKNYYLYATGLCLFLAFLWRSLLSTIGLFQVKNGINYLYLFLGYITVMLVSKWITKIFVHFQKKPENPFRKKMNLNILPEKEKAK